ncbi:hypothetical protein K2173_001670 [Erythroxylum novogranatense]|uniref:C3H1-type domain-containing protein n=1 Tax=Erythroxylum novogranatense TaxID=1862640 RepID=A0AAV8T5N0_9ROSI|nr:hypothetical protein K2173_001670 [Erythroxylum novogranatense]
MQLVESYKDQIGVNEVSSEKNRSQLSAAEEGDNVFLLMKENSKQCGYSNAYLHGTKGMASETTSTCIIVGTQGDDDLVKGNCLDEKPSIVVGSEIQDVPMDLGSDKELISSSRLVTSNIKTRSLSPSSEFKDGNKRPAVICDFFAKGWCIRGSSCRFLHINDKVDNTNQQPEAMVSSTNLTREDQLHEGMNTDKPNLLSFDQSNASSTGKDAAMCHLSARNLLPQHQDTQSLCKFDEKHKFSSPQREDLSFATSQPFPSSTCDPKVSQFKDAGVEDNMKIWAGSGYGSHPSRRNNGNSLVVQHSLLAEHRSLKDSALTSSNYYNGDPSSQMSRLEVLKCIQSQHVSSSNRDPSFSSSAMVPAHRTSTWMGPAFSFSTSMNASMHGLQKLLDNDREHHVTRSSSLLQRASSFSGSEPENLPQTSVSAEPSYYGEHKAMISSNDWEPSIPFQPSFSMTPATLSSVGSQYDPFHDSIDSSVGRKSFKFSFFNQENTILNASHQLISNDSLLSQNPGQECNGDKGSMSSHIRFPENLLDKNERPFVPRYPEEENASTTSCVKNIPKKNKVDVDHNARKVSDGSRHKRFMSNDDIEVDQKTEGDVAKETKALRHFRAALVDFVKDILKPTWREGHLSKDAHNMIVKKTVEKVVSALQTHQAPATVDSIKQYLSSSQLKITKLVEGYVTNDVYILVFEVLENLFEVNCQSFILTALVIHLVCHSLSPSALHLCLCAGFEHNSTLMEMSTGRDISIKMKRQALSEREEKRVYLSVLFVCIAC